VAVPQPLRGAVFEDANAVLRGAIDGQGVTLGWMPLIQSELDSGAIVRLLQETVTSRKQYHIRMGQQTRKPRDAGAVIAWLRAQGRI
jgi:LysR family glycine cleavage system transcriptional activator